MQIDEFEGTVVSGVVGALLGVKTTLDPELNICRTVLCYGANSVEQEPYDRDTGRCA
jgi:hypothetical protein